MSFTPLLLILCFSLSSFQSLAILWSKKKRSRWSIICQRTCRWRAFPKLCSGNSQLTRRPVWTNPYAWFLFSWCVPIIGHNKWKATWGDNEFWYYNHIVLSIASFFFGDAVVKLELWYGRLFQPGPYPSIFCFSLGLLTEICFWRHQKCRPPRVVKKSTICFTLSTRFFQWKHPFKCDTEVVRKLFERTLSRLNNFAALFLTLI